MKRILMVAVALVSFSGVQAAGEATSSNPFVLAWAKTKAAGSKVSGAVSKHATQARDEMKDAFAKPTCAGKAKAVVSSKYVYVPVVTVALVAAAVVGGKYVYEQSKKDGSRVKVAKDVATKRMKKARKAVLKWWNSKKAPTA